MKQLLIGAVLTVLGAALAFGGKSYLAKAKASSEWPSVKGTVVASSVKRRRSTGGRRAGGGRRRTTRYKAYVSYEYTVDDQPFESDQILFGSSSGPSASKRLVEKYPVGGQVDVYYEPPNPAESVLMPGVFSSTYAMLVFGLVLLVVGLLISAAPLTRVVLRALRPHPVSNQ